jgi:hypothetical protein
MPKNLPEKEHFCPLKYSILFPETWWEREYFEVKDGPSTICNNLKPFLT